MKFLVIALLLLSIIQGWFLNIEISTNREQEKQIQRLTQNHAEESRRESLALQEKCARQAEKIFRELGYNQVSDQLQSHYNQKLNRCFMAAITESGNNMFLTDAYEERDYANFSQVFIKGDTLHPLVTCSLMPLGSEQRSCSTYKEYADFIEKYLN